MRSREGIGSERSRSSFATITCNVKPLLITLYCWLVALSFPARAVPTASPESILRVRKVWRHGLATEPLCGANSTAFVNEDIPALRPTCDARSGLIHWRDDHQAELSFNVTISLFHSNRRCDSLQFRFAKPKGFAAVQLDLKWLTNRLTPECQNLKTSLIAVQRCHPDLGCGLVPTCLPADFCSRNFADPRLHGAIKPHVVAHRVNLYETPWDIGQSDRFAVLVRRGPSSSPAQCNLKKTCNLKKKRCILACKKLQACTRYDFCPYVHYANPGRRGILERNFNRSRCSPGQGNWLPVTTNYSKEQSDLLASMTVDIVRLNGSSALAILQGNRQMGAAEATTVHLQLCLEPGTEDHRTICLDRSIDFGGQAETLLVLTGLVPSVHYEPSVWACLHCSDKLCASVRTKSSLWWLYQGLVSMGVLLEYGSESQNAAFTLSWHSTLAERNHSNLCSLSAHVQCNDGRPEVIVPIQNNQSILYLPSMANGRRRDVICHVWLSLSLRQRTSNACQPSVPISQVHEVRIRNDPSNLFPASSQVLPSSSSNVGPSESPDAKPSITIPLSISCVFVLLTLVLILAVAHSCRKRRSSRGHQSLSGLLSRPNGSEDSASPCSPADHTYEKLKTVIYSTRQAANRPPHIITNAAVAAPPLPSSPRPVHILSNPGGSVRPPSGNYARLFAQ